MRAVKIEHAIGGMDADDQLRAELGHLLVQETRLRLGQRRRPRPAPWVFAGAFFPVVRGIALPARGVEVAVQVHTPGIHAGGAARQQAVGVEHRDEAPVHGLWRLLGKSNPVQRQRGRGQLIPMHGPHHQHPQGRNGGARHGALRQHIAPVQRPPLPRYAATGHQSRVLAQGARHAGQARQEQVTGTRLRAGLQGRTVPLRSAGV